MVQLLFFKSAKDVRENRVARLNAGIHSLDFGSFVAKQWKDTMRYLSGTYKEGVNG